MVPVVFLGPRPAEAVALLEGRVSLGIDLDLFLNLASLSYTFEKPVLGGRYTVGAAIPFQIPHPRRGKDGSAQVDVVGSTYAGDPIGCDPNGDGQINAADIACTILIIFLGPGACG